MYSDLDTQELQLLLSKISFYRKTYNVETDTGWRKSNYYLTDNALIRALNSERSTVGIFSCYQTNFFVVDIDNHDDKANVSLIYSQIYNILGKPSIVCKSPHGLHAYYCLQDYYDANLLSSIIKSIVKINVEVKPTPNTSIRILSKENLLDQDTLKRTNKDFLDYLNECTTYNVSEFLCLADIKEKRIKKDSIDIIFKGETNHAMNTLIPQWKSKGYSDEECTNKFIAKLDSSYTGDCRNYSHVLKRVKCYEVLPSSNSKIDSLKDVEKDNVELINSIVSKYRSKSKTNEYNKNLRSNSIKDVVIGILYAKKDSECVIQDPELLSIYNTRYPFYEYEVTRGCVPLPTSFFKSIRKNYRPIFNYLYSIGFIKRKHGRSYDSTRHSCQYYSIDMQCMNKYSEYAYCKLVNTQDIKSNIRLLLTSVFNVHYYVINLFKYNIGSFLVSDLVNIRFNMLYNQVSNYKKFDARRLLFSG